MSQDASLRQHLVKLLTGSEAHVNFDAAIKDLPANLRGERPKGADHSPWELLEHLRIAQRDILEYAIDPRHKSPDWPSGYWPAALGPASDAEWENSVKAFRADLKRLCDLVLAEQTDLTAKIPHADGQTILRQALLTADHNAYHVGQLVLVRRLLGAWK